MMKSNFLNLPSSIAGDALRHVPFRSIINKHISILFVLVFVFSIMFSYVYPVAALADPQPEYDPVYNTEIIRLTDYVNNELTPDQQDIFYIAFGAYLVAQGAMQDSLLEDPYTTQDGVVGWLKSCGIQLYNSAIVQNALMAPSLLVQNGLQDLVDIAMGLAIKAGLYQDKVHFIDDIMSSDHYFFPFNRGLQIGINNVLALNGGLYDWQDDIPYEFENYWSYSAKDLQGQYESDYISAVSNLITPRHLCASHQGTNWIFNAVTGTFNGVDKFDLFIDTNDHYVYFYLSNDQNVLHNVQFVCWNNNAYNVQTTSLDVYFNRILYEPSWFSSYVDILDYVFRQDYQTSSGVGLLSCNYYLPLIFNSQEFVKDIYIGTDWNNKSLFSPNMTLNFSDDDILYYLQLQNDYLLDLKGIIQDLINVTVLKPVIYDNIYDPSGNQVSPVTNQVSVTVSLPDSGVDIPNNLFAPLTKDGGYISYLWYMTKPLVQYTSDFVQTLVFPDDTGEGFDVTGPGAIVFGVISLGLIGGLVVKCLL